MINNLTDTPSIDKIKIVGPDPPSSVIILLMFDSHGGAVLMKAVILAGGLGTRLSEETHLRPKPMIEIGGKPILWHILKGYSVYGVNEFIICCGYKGYMIKEYFANYFLHTSNVTFHMDNDNRVEIHDRRTEPWKITLVDTGDHTQTGGRLLRVRPYLGCEPFFFTYGDGLSDVNIQKLLSHHQSLARWATLTAVRPPGRYGLLNIDSSIVKSFDEKLEPKRSYINGGFFVLETCVFDLIQGDDTSFENHVLPIMAKDEQLGAYMHSGFWHAMDTLRDRNHLQGLWDSNRATWRTW